MWAAISSGLRPSTALGTVFLGLLIVCNGITNVILNKKFWEELIRLLSLHKSFEVLEPNLMGLKFIQFNLN
jgi:hypothetical protein